ncbi:hypothetical protein LK07_27015 [Streptomyces pluripotens]|uniref:Uncharacterized protein n=1 Tax=Streptomyces pluripotens TaxID=1355015 RepID=A0A221P5I3_9ACTN|nr:hypothetical protein LK06_025860 [Streptomyces pluripotens]ASN27065.1 hypothetical protein LK07_27015 [Streptomyces pluripotens]KIE23625.1 hypothetical protein LK08_28940 [Streptomyces sp. MUSC 125]
MLVGELRQASCGARFGGGLPLFLHCGVSLWALGTGGEIAPGGEVHDLILSVFGGVFGDVFEGERNRLKIRCRP